MDYMIHISGLDGCVWSFDLLKFSDYQRIDVPSVVIFDICKCHNHRYDLQGFFYFNKSIIGPYTFRSKRDLYGAIQDLLQKFLNIDVQ